nr:hypothetical protein GCM10020092_026200 [Actinoplanes digitatis]
MAEGVLHGLPDAHAARAVPVPPAPPLAGLVRGPVPRGGEQRVAVHREQVERVAEGGGLGRERERVDHREARQVGGHALERARPELRERVVPSPAA